MRTFWAAVIGLVAATYITIVAVGYAHLGTLPRLATYKPTSSTSEIVASVTPTGRAAGLRAGDIIDRTRLSSADLEFIGRTIPTGIAGTNYRFPVIRNGAPTELSFELQPAHDRTLRDSLDIALRIIMTLTGLFLIARGRDALSLYAGLYFATWPLAQGFSFTYNAAGLSVAVILQFTSIVILVAGFMARFLFGYELLPKPTGRAIAASFYVFAVAITLTEGICAIVRLTPVYTPLQVSAAWGFVYGAMQPIANIVTLLLIGLAVVLMDREKAKSVRIIFWAFAVGLAGPTVNGVLNLAGQPIPLYGALNLTYLVPAVVLPYVLFTRRLIAIDFFVSKAAIYAIVLSIIVGVFVLLERLLEQLALSRTASIALQLAVPLALGFSLKWIERGTESFVERLLYRSKLRATDRLNALASDFPHMHDISALTRRVTDEVRREMRLPGVVLYQQEEEAYIPISEAPAGAPLHPPVGIDDPAFVRLRSTHKPVETAGFQTSVAAAGLLIPLVVFGKVTGALYCQYRESGERFDPDEVDVLANLARDLAVAMVWMSRDRESAATASHTI
jgi:hypothetical protein